MSFHLIPLKILFLYRLIPLKNDSSEKKIASSEKHGFVLLSTMLFVTLILCALGIWYRKVVLQSHLAQQYLNQRVIHLEINHLLPLLYEKVKTIPSEKWTQEERSFLELEEKGKIRWIIDRSAIQSGKVVFTFHHLKNEKTTFSTMYPTTFLH